MIAYGVALYPLPFTPTGSISSGSSRADIASTSWSSLFLEDFAGVQASDAPAGGQPSRYGNNPGCHSLPPRGVDSCYRCPIGKGGVQRADLGTGGGDIIIDDDLGADVSPFGEIRRE
jgi:hypothetical protein